MTFENELDSSPQIDLCSLPVIFQLENNSNLISSGDVKQVCLRNTLMRGWCSKYLEKHVKLKKSQLPKCVQLELSQSKFD